MRDHAHEDKVLGSFEGIGHNCKAERRLKREDGERGGHPPYAYSICTNDGLRLAESDHEKLSAKKFILSLLE
jgi:hypothetical protein